MIAVDSDGVVLQYDIPLEDGEERPSIHWQYPARVRKSDTTTLTLLNRVEMEARCDKWLELAAIPADACGEWYFTWNAFQVECDPDDTLAFLTDFDMTPDGLRTGALLVIDGALEPASLQETAAYEGGTTYVAKAAVDPDQIREERAFTDVIVSGFMQENLTYEDARAKRQTEAISGTIVVTLKTDATGVVQQRTSLTTIKTITNVGERETLRSTRTMLREPQ